MNDFLGAFAELRKSNVSFVMPACLRMEQQGFHWTNLHDVGYKGLLWNSDLKVQLWLKSDKNLWQFTRRRECVYNMSLNYF